LSTATTFNSLSTDISSYLERGTTSTQDPIFQTQLPRLINLAERRIARELKVEGLQNTVTSVMQSGVAVYQRPDRWRKDISINFGSGTNNNVRSPLFVRSYEYLRNYFPDDSVTGIPRFYAEYDPKHWIIAPTPSSAYPFEALYYELPRLLGADNQTNWLTDLAPQVLLYASLIECAMFLKSDGAKQQWQAEYDRALSAINNEEMKKILDRSVTQQDK